MNFTNQYGDDLINVQVDDIWTADLVDISSLSRSDGARNTLIDVFSKYGWIVPLKTKTGKEVALVFWKYFLSNTTPSNLWTDKGTEFYKQQLKAVLAANNVTLWNGGTERRRIQCESTLQKVTHKNI